VNQPPSLPLLAGNKVYKILLMQKLQDLSPSYTTLFVLVQESEEREECVPEERASKETAEPQRNPQARRRDPCGQSRSLSFTALSSFPGEKTRRSALWRSSGLSSTVFYRLLIRIVK